MAENTNNIKLKTPEGPTIEYLLENNPIGAGRIGEVFRGYNATDINLKEELAIKRSKPNFEKYFHDNVKTIAGQSISHTIPFKIVGTSGNGSYINTAVMEYGGSNLKAVYDTICDSVENGKIRPQVAQAFQYKVLYTVLEALEDAQNQKICHGDLIPYNILCGFELKEGMSPSDLEDKLIHGEIRLCDRAGIKDVATAFVKDASSMNVDEVKFIGAFLDPNLTDISLDGDLYSFFHLFSWMEDKVPTKPVTASAKKYLGLKIDISDDGEKNIYPSLGEIKKSLQTVIEKEGYFDLTKVTKGNGDKYHIVQRPLDQFRAQWEGEKLLTLNDLAKLYTVAGNHSKYSYQSLTNKGGSKLGPEEKEQMGLILGEVVLQSAYAIAEEHSKVINSRLEATVKQKALGKEHETAKEKLANLNDLYLAGSTNFKSQTTKFTNNQTPENADALKKAADILLERSTALNSQKGDLDRIISEKSQEIEAAKREVKGFNPKPLVEALGFIVNTVHNTLPKDYQQNFEEFARKNEQLYMEIAAAAPPAPRAVVPKPAVTKPNLGPGKYDMSDDKDDDDDDDDRLRGD